MSSIDKFNITLNRKQYLIFIFILGVIGIVSLLAGLNNAWVNFVDFQQPAACLFISGESPYAYAFELGESYKENWSKPNYLHALYFLQSPLCIFDDAIARLVWGLINTGLAIWISYTLSKMANRPEYFILITLFFFASLPFRNGIGNDQNQILILTFFVLSMQANSSWLKGLFGALSFIKYSFAGSWIGMTFYRDKLAVIWSGLFVVLMMLGGALWISSGNFIIDFLGPFMVASNGVRPGHGDLLTMIDYIFDSQYQYRTVVGASLLVLNTIVVAWITRKSMDPLFILAIAGVSSLMFVTHLGYDGVFLLPALVFLIAKGGGASLVGVATIVYT